MAWRRCSCRRSCGISGDRPIILLRMSDMPCVHELLLSQRYWQAEQLGVDIVLLDTSAGHGDLLPGRVLLKRCDVLAGCGGVPTQGTHGLHSDTTAFKCFRCHFGISSGVVTWLISLSPGLIRSLRVWLFLKGWLHADCDAIES